MQHTLVLAATVEDRPPGYVLFGLLLYVIPTAIAIVRKLPNRRSIIATNLLLGWTGIGWIAALVLAFSKPDERAAFATPVVIDDGVAATVSERPQARPDATRSDLPTRRAVPQWARDPFGRFDKRFFDGSSWTGNVVAVRGEQSYDPPTAAAPTAGTGWHPDPFGRFVTRYFDGNSWTEQVRDAGGATMSDEPTHAAPARRTPPPPTPPDE